MGVDNLSWKPYEDYDYTEFWKDRKYEDLAERKALHKLWPSNGKRLIDLGANYGRLTNEFLRYKEVVLSDGAKSAIWQGRKLWPNSNCYFVASDLYYSPFQSGVFDVVVCVRTIHHLTHPEGLFSEAKRLLKPGGYIILEFANKRNIKQLILQLFGKSNRQPTALEPSRLGDSIFNYHPSHIMSLAKSQGFVCEKIIGVSIFRSGVIKKLIPFRLLVWLDGILQDFNGRYFLTPSIFVKAQKID